MPGRCGVDTLAVPTSRSGDDSIIAPAFHSASRRDTSNDSPNTPAVASASSCFTDIPGTRRTRSSVSTNGRAASICAASCVPMPRTEPMPSRTASPPVERGSGSSHAPARDALMSGVRTTTPCRRASCTNVCGDQNPIGCELTSAAQKMAGSWNLIHADEYTRYAKLTE